MKTIEAIRWALRMTDEGIAALVEDLRDVPLTRPTPGARGGDGNHPLWTRGRLAVIEGSIPEVLFAEPTPVAHWKPLHGSGTRPLDDPGVYPAFDEVLGTFRRLRAGTLRLLDEIGEGGLGRVPKNVPPGFIEAMRTLGQTFLLIALHQMVHSGQIADARRVAGRKPLL